MHLRFVYFAQGFVYMSVRRYVGSSADLTEFRKQVRHQRKPRWAEVENRLLRRWCVFWLQFVAGTLERAGEG